MVALLIALLILMSVIMAAGWAYQRTVGNGGWTDVFWTYGMGLTAVLACLWPIPGAPPTLRGALVALMAFTWSVRLGTHVALRVARSPREDARYAHFRAEWGRAFQARMFGFLQIQAPAGMLLILSIASAARRPGDALLWSDWVGLGIWAIAIGGESLADRQLSRFKAYPGNRNRVCDVGLWGWSRHPNYFFEWLSWIAYAVIAVDLSGAWPWGWAGLIAPAYMYYLLRYVTGVPPLEASMARSKGEAFEAYRRRTSIFLPLPPKEA